MVLRGLGNRWVFIIDCRAILASANAVWVVLRGLGRHWVIVLDRRAMLASVG